MAEDVNRLIEQIVEEAAGREEAKAAAPGADDVRRFFCEHWDEIKKVIEFLCQRLKGLEKLACEILIRLGDRLYDRLCPR